MSELLFSIFRKGRKFLSGTGIGKLPLVMRVYHFLYQYLRPKGIVLIEAQGHKMHIDSRDIGVSPYLIMDGVYGKTLTRLFKKIVKKEMTVVDIGAHVGYCTLITANLVGENGIVWAFEPEPNNYDLLVKNLKINNYHNVIPVQKAVSNRVGTTKLFLSPENTGGHSIYNLYGGRTSIEIETVSLDEFFKNRENKIDIIKMDVEGAEMTILQGMNKILKKNDNLKIITEFSPMLLRRSGYSPEEYLNEYIKYGFKLYDINEQKDEIIPIGIDRLMEMYTGKKSTNLLCLKGSW